MYTMLLIIAGICIAIVAIIAIVVLVATGTANTPSTTSTTRAPSTPSTAAINCPPKDIMCSGMYDPVCAEFNGTRTTYSNDCVAELSCAKVLTKGPC